MAAGGTEASIEGVLHGMHHGLQAVVSAEFLVDAVPLIPRRGQSDTQFASDLGRVFGLRE